MVIRLHLMCSIGVGAFGIGQAQNIWHQSHSHVFGSSHENGYVEQSENCLKKLIEKVGLPTVKDRAVAKKAT